VSDLASILEFAVGTARQAGELTRHYFQTDFQIDIKADSSPVTIADRESEQLMRRLIAEKYPTHSILGEEYGETNPGSSHRWILDPIDGTFSFVRGVPLYGVMMGLEIEGQAVLGVVNFPALGEIVYAAQGQGCFLNGKPTHVSTVSQLSDALVVSGNVPKGADGPFWRIHQQAKAFRGWSDCYAHTLVATGRAEIALDPEMNLWDNAALLPILLEAGGTFTDYQGQTTIYGESAISTNGLLFEQVMALIK